MKKKKKKLKELTLRHLDAWKACDWGFFETCTTFLLTKLTLFSHREHQYIEKRVKKKEEPGPVTSKK
jgi:hypothetical protein